MKNVRSPRGDFFDSHCTLLGYFSQFNLISEFFLHCVFPLFILYSIFLVTEMTYNVSNGTAQCSCYNSRSLWSNLLLNMKFHSHIKEINHHRMNILACNLIKCISLKSHCYFFLAFSFFIRLNALDRRCCG